MITMGTITLAGAFVAVLAAAGPDTDPRIRMGAAVGIIVTAISATIRTGVAAAITAARTLHKDIENLRREYQGDMCEVATLQRRIVARSTDEVRRQLVDWPPLPATDDTGPQPIHNR